MLSYLHCNQYEVEWVLKSVKSAGQDVGVRGFQRQLTCWLIRWSMISGGRFRREHAVLRSAYSAIRCPRYLPLTYRRVKRLGVSPSEISLRTWTPQTVAPSPNRRDALHAPLTRCAMFSGIQHIEKRRVRAEKVHEVPSGTYPAADESAGLTEGSMMREPVSADRWLRRYICRFTGAE
ncbi:hypothetical protein KCP73_21485 [Salmonella enterica subsp. enterica]|nr:hypothetical protein KCP73_21485 [Salmonella enterica subsp. enterica]